MPTITTMKACFTTTTASRWCVNANGTALSAASVQPATAYCCADLSTDPKCIDGDNYYCTLNNKGQMPVTLWSTYWPGINSVCGGNLSATEVRQSVSVNSLAVTNRTSDTVYVEACLYYISAPTNLFHKTAEIWVYLDTSLTS